MEPPILPSRPGIMLSIVLLEFVIQISFRAIALDILCLSHDQICIPGLSRGRLQYCDETGTRYPWPRVCGHGAHLLNTMSN